MVWGKGLGFRVYGFELRVQEFWFRLWGLGVRLRNFGFGLRPLNRITPNSQVCDLGFLGVGFGEEVWGLRFELEVYVLIKPS